MSEYSGLRETFLTSIDFGLEFHYRLLNLNLTLLWSIMLAKQCVEYVHQTGLTLSNFIFFSQQRRNNHRVSYRLSHNMISNCITTTILHNTHYIKTICCSMYFHYTLYSSFCIWFSVAELRLNDDQLGAFTNLITGEGHLRLPLHYY